MHGPGFYLPGTLCNTGHNMHGGRTLGRGTLGRGTLGRERKIRVDSRSGAGEPVM